MNVSRRGFFGLVASAGLAAAASSTRLGQVSLSWVSAETSIVELIKRRMLEAEASMAAHIAQSIYEVGP